VRPGRFPDRHNARARVAVREPTQSPFEIAWRERFRRYAASREDDAGIAGWSTSGLGARVRRFESLLRGPLPDTTWLDAGCGAGTYTRLLADRGARVVGLDYSLTSALKASVRDRSGSAYAAGDVCRLPFATESFNGVLCFGVTQALSNTAPAVRELTRVTVAGGEIWIDALNQACVVHLVGVLVRRLKGRSMHLRYEFPDSLRRLMREQGLQPVELHWLPILPGRWQTMQRLLETRVARGIFRRVPLVGMLLSHAFIVRAVKPSST
jgi:SAM-dependent methyltransferase